MKFINIYVHDIIQKNELWFHEQGKEGGKVSSRNANNSIYYESKVKGSETDASTRM